LALALYRAERKLQPAVWAAGHEILKSRRSIKEPLGSEDWYVNGAIEIETKFKPVNPAREIQKHRARHGPQNQKRWGMDYDLESHDALGKKTLKIPIRKWPIANLC
jgi:7,8-dihydro-6-hydroxymethylpterin-pyrophosphokinase